MNPFTFNISLSVLNHLGRNLYRNFITVLWEAISNSRDADAENVWIHIDKDNGTFTIIDDWSWMWDSDFQNKFLKIWYSKRKDNDYKTIKNRPPIWRKWIGKLALLSCAEKITVISKTDEWIISWSIDNAWLDQAITDDRLPQDYQLEPVNLTDFEQEMQSIEHWTIIYFENFNEGIKNTLEHLKKIIAMNFRFSLYDNSFHIFLNWEEISFTDLSWLSNKTEFLWEINNNNDPFIDSLNHVKESRVLQTNIAIKWFIASVEKPSDLKILWTGEKATIDLFVNGRIREKDILKHMSTARVAESYLYWQVSFDLLDDWGEIDRFTSSREGIVNDDQLYQNFLVELKEKILRHIIADRDKRRIENREDWDVENESIPKKERKAKELYNSVSEDYVKWTQEEGNQNENIVQRWVEELWNDASYNFSSYAECFISENLLRKYINHTSTTITPEAATEISKWRGVEEAAKNTWNISIEVRQNNNDLLYMDMKYLSNMIDKVDPIKTAGLSRDANEYKPMRDAMAHTALLTEDAKLKLTSVFHNIKYRIINLLRSFNND